MRYLLIVILLSIGASPVFAQEESQNEPKGFDWQEVRSRLYFQPGGSFFISNGVLLVGLAPSIGYRLLPQLSLGVGPIFTYFKVLGTDRSAYEWGGNAFLRQRIGQMLFVQAEYEQINRQVAIQVPGNGVSVVRQWVPGFLLGGGLFQQIGGSGGFVAGLFYNVLWDANRSSTNSPLVTRVAFVF